MKKGPILVVTAITGLATGGLIALQALKAPPVSGLSITEIAPDSVVYYAQADGLRERWDGIRRTQAWEDFQGSALLAKIRENADVQAFLDGLEELSAKVDYDIDAENALKFFGTEVGFGVELDPDERRLRSLLLTRLDVTALALELLQGGADWRDLQEELNRRTALADFRLSTREYEDYVITTAQRGDSTYYAVQIEDVLAISDSDRLLERAVDTRIAGGTGSLARLDLFARETESIPDDAVAYDWINVGALDGQRARIALTFGRTPEFNTARFVDTVLDALSGTDAVSRSYRLPDDDLYRVTWEWSRPADEIFADKRSPAVFDVLPHDAMLYLEGRDLGGVVDAWNRSAVRRNIAATPLWGHFEDLLESARDTASAVPGGSIAVDPFTVKFAGHVFSQQIEALFVGDLGMAAEGTMDAGQYSGVGAIRLGTEGRFVELLVRAVAVAGTDGLVETLEHRGETFHGGRAAADTDPLYWAQLGDLWVFSNKEQSLRDAIDGAAGAGPSGRPVALERAMADFEPSYHVFCYVDFERILEEVDPGEIAPIPESEKEELAKALEMNVTPYSASAVYIPDDFSHIEVRWVTPFSDDVSEDAEQLLGAMESGVLRGVDALPSDTFFYAGGMMDLAEYRRFMGSQESSLLTKTMEKGVEEIEKALDMDLDEELLPAFGREFGFAVGHRAPPRTDSPFPDPGEDFVAPTFTLIVGVRDRAAMERVVERAAKAVNESRRTPDDPDDPDDPVASRELIAVEDELMGHRLWRLQFTGEPVEASSESFMPCGMFVGDFFVVTTDETVLLNMLAVQDGAAPPFSRSEVVERMADAGFAAEGLQLYLLDWNTMLDQLSQFASLAGALAASVRDVSYPEYPEDGDAAEWQRRMDDHKRAVAEARERGTTRVREVLDSFRFIDFMATRTEVEDGLMGGRAMLGFTR